MQLLIQARMARKRTPRVNPPVDLEVTQDEIDLFEFMDEIGPSVAVVEIFQMKKDGSRPHCERVTMDVLREDVYEYLRSNFGPGKYLLQFKGADRTIQKSKVVEVAGRPGASIAAGLAPAAAGQEQHLQYLREQNAQQQTLLTALISGLAQRPIPDFKLPDPAAMLTAVAAVFSTIRGNGNDDWLEKTKTVIGIAKDLQPSEKGEDSWPALIRDVGKEVVGAMRTPQLPAPAQEPNALAENPDRRPAGSTFPAPAALPPENSFEGWLRSAIGYLKQKAQLGKDPEIYVNWVFDNPEEPPCSALRAAVERGGTVEHLLQFDKEIAENPLHVLWFKKLHAGIVRAIQDEQQDGNGELDSARPAGNGGDTRSDEGVGAAG